LSKRSAKTAKTVSERVAPDRLRFFDASAVAKLYLDEPQSAAVRRQMASGPVAVSRLSAVEVPSAISRRWRDGLLSIAQRDSAIDAFSEDMKEWWIIELTDDLSRRAVELLGLHRLRSGDAIQLASALIARDRSSDEFGRFVAYDARLLAAAIAEGLPTEGY
jgi:predicted nucleic acid-binding protein